jgi:ATP synthase protein I
MRAPGSGGTGGKSDTGAKNGRPDPSVPREGTGWSIVSYLVGGMLLYGGVGWLVGRWTHIAVLTGVGIVLGIGLSLALIVFRFTRQ